MSDKIYPSMVIRSQAEAIELLEQENQQLKDKIKTLNNQLDKELIKRARLEDRINKAVDKLYCWGEVLDAKFQKEMLDLLKGDKE